MLKSIKKLAIVRTSIFYQSITHYNSQELGLALELSKKNVLIDIFYASKDNEEHVVNINEAIKIIYLPTIRFYKQQGLLKNIYSFLEKENYDLIQVAEESMVQSVLISMHAKKKKIPVILMQGMYDSHSGVFKQVFQKTYNFFLLPILRKNIELAICKTTSARDYLSKLNFKNTVVIPVGLNSEKINNPHHLINKLPNIDLSKKIILYIGKIEERRNPKFILELAGLYESNKDLVFVCVGNGTMEEDFIKNKGKNVIHINKLEQNQLQYLYKRASVFLMPTNYEIFGMVYLECMYFGVPVISTINAGSKDLFKNKFDSYLLESLDLSKWKTHIDLIISNSNIRDKFSERLKKKALRYEWAALSENYFAQCQNVVSTYIK